jgi:dedicator of cytokinesis protein 3
MRHQAALLEHIINTQRYYPEYFRVAFYGNFPVAIRNKQFIVRLDIHHRSGANPDGIC